MMMESSEVFKPIKAWHDEQPLWHPFSKDAWQAQVATLAGNMPANAQMSLCHDKRERCIVYNFRGRRLSSNGQQEHYSYSARGELEMHRENYHISRVDVDANFAANGTGGTLFAAQVAAAADAGLTTASIQSAEMGTYTWAGYKLPMDWSWTFADDFRNNLVQNLERARKRHWIDEDTHRSFLDAIVTEDPDILVYLTEDEALQALQSHGGRTMPGWKHVLKQAGNWRSEFELDGPVMDRIFDVVAEKQAGGRMQRVTWRPAKQAAQRLGPV